jgi:hypothetical protein
MVASSNAMPAGVATSGEETGPAAAGTLQPVERAVDLDDARRVEAGPLEVAIDVGGEDERPPLHPRRPAPQDGEALVRSRGAVQVQAVAVEAPGQRGVAGEPVRPGQVDEAQRPVPVAEADQSRGPRRSQ